VRTAGTLVDLAVRSGRSARRMAGADLALHRGSDRSRRPRDLLSSAARVAVAVSRCRPASAEARRIRVRAVAGVRLAGLEARGPAPCDESCATRWAEFLRHARR